ncbi:MAG: DsbA family oxidoreductase [Caulobacterales bacterium]|nr:DsbA family oxidoreductase [Caulobacterales bacterium]
MPVQIKMTSDFICPWCLIGHSRLQAAIASLPGHVEVAVEWLPFELNPDMPVEGLDRRLYRTMKFGSWERSRTLDAQTVKAAATDPITFDYDAIARTPNTFAAHRLAWFAARQGRQGEVVQAVLSAYFEQGRDIGDPAVLADIAAEVGLDRAETVAFLAGDDGRAEVRALIEQAPSAGVHGVPHFDIGGVGVSGAQPAALLKEAILRAGAAAAA